MMELIDTLKCGCGGNTEIWGDERATVAYNEEMQNIQYTHIPRPLGQATENSLNATIESLQADKAEAMNLIANVVKTWKPNSSKSEQGLLETSLLVSLEAFTDKHSASPTSTEDTNDER